MIIESMEPVRHFVPEALAALIRKAPTTPEKIAFAWRHSVGAAVDKATSVELVGTTLRVRVQSRQWQREIQKSAAVVRTRLSALLGDDVVRKIEVVEPEQPASRIESVRRK